MNKDDTNKFIISENTNNLNMYLKKMGIKKIIKILNKTDK